MIFIGKYTKDYYFDLIQKMKNFKKILFLLSPSERRGAAYLLFMILCMAIFDVLGVASILPFMAVLTNPDLVETNQYLNYLFQIVEVFGVQTKKQFLLLLGFFVFFMLIVSLSFKALTNYSQTLFTTMREYSVAKRLVEAYLNQPYSWFLNRNSADLGKSILSEVGMIISLCVQPLIHLIAHSAVAIALLILLILSDTILTLIVCLTFGGSYALIYFLTRKYLNRIGKERISANERRFTILSEAFGASKEVKILGLESVYVNNFSKSAKIFAKHQASVKIISQLPRFALEAVAFGGMLLLSLFFITKKGGIIDTIPLIALYAFAGYRLIPALQNIYVAFAQMRFSSPALEALYNDMKNLEPSLVNINKYNISMKETIRLKNISYKYPNSSKFALTDISFNIPAKSTIGIVGITGSGKTTLVDIILGLLNPQSGTLEVDGEIITKNNVRDWQSKIGYVPQSIFLSDDTIASNIAFGISPEEVNLDSVKRAAKIANLNDFVMNELPDQYMSKVGERGVRLSGGQLQRIGIARALYHNPKVLILDEATSALDGITEKKILSSLFELNREITVIFITHRLSTISNCDKIFLLKSGKLIHQGSYHELLAMSPEFRKMQKIETLKKK